MSTATQQKDWAIKARFFMQSGHDLYAVAKRMNVDPAKLDLALWCHIGGVREVAPEVRCETGPSVGGRAPTQLAEQARARPNTSAA